MLMTVALNDVSHISKCLMQGRPHHMCLLIHTHVAACFLTQSLHHPWPQARHKLQKLHMETLTLLFRRQAKCALSKHHISCTPSAVETNLNALAKPDSRWGSGFASAMVPDSMSATRLVDPLKAAHDCGHLAHTRCP